MNFSELAKTAFASTVAILLAGLVHGHYYKCTPRAEPVIQSASVCYGQIKPNCNLGQKPVCICTGDNAQSCSYVCM
jgi:hypothetical protein